MSKKIIWLILFVLSLSLVGCKNFNKQDPKHAKEKLMNMEGYASVIEITYIDGEQSNTYGAKQLYLMDGRYRLEVTQPEHIVGLTTLYNGEKVFQYNPNIQDSTIIELPVNQFRNQIFLGSFVDNYLQSPHETSNPLELEAAIPGNNFHMSIQRVWLDELTHNPIRMSIYNKDNQETIAIKFVDFVYNPKVDESVFKIN